MPVGGEGSGLTLKELRRLQTDFLGTPKAGAVPSMSRGHPVPSSAWQTEMSPRALPPSLAHSGGRVLGPGGAGVPRFSTPSKVYPKLTPEVLGHGGPRQDLPGEGVVSSHMEEVGDARVPLLPEVVRWDASEPSRALQLRELLSDPGRRDLWRDGIYSDLLRDRGAQDLVRDRGLQDSLRLGAPLGGGLLTEIVLVASAARSGGLATHRHPLGDLLGVRSPTRGQTPLPTGARTGRAGETPAAPSRRRRRRAPVPPRARTRRTPSIRSKARRATPRSKRAK